AQEGGGGGLGMVPVFDLAPAGPPARGIAARASAAAPVVPVVTIDSDLTLDESHFLVVGRGASSLKVELPPSQPANAGRQYVVKNVDVTRMNVAAAEGDTVEEKQRISVRKGKGVTLIADGAGHWHSLGLE
ncbi:MAG TPA: hypothetical protein VN923_00600, partial [Thermoanaerobaculia bacterium]|nr:hypothetical protein [Thermoanaerobaculia bacterium]